MPSHIPPASDSWTAARAAFESTYSKCLDLTKHQDPNHWTSQYIDSEVQRLWSGWYGCWVYRNQEPQS